MNRLLHLCLSILMLVLGVAPLQGTQAAPTVIGNTSPKGISFHVLRVVYPESKRNGVTLTAYNETDRPYLMQSRIQSVDLATGNADMSPADKKVMPFIVTPPLARIEPNGELVLRIRRNGEKLLTDRESVFFVSMKAIPAQADPRTRAADSQQLILTVVSNMKLFYRPDGLNKRALADTDVASQLRFRREGSQLIADNPTPYWLTFSRLKVGKTALDKAQLRLMVSPMGEQHYTLPEGTAGSVSWQLIDEDGWDTPAQQRPL
ncbi:molecular chaperone [Serratia fonticola]|uniref:fimbrial biogenesis chaperone n=1 Tax=Serratia fonticola TaxID=47917 RepID=UPI001F38DE80|nr:molecular chaperone [Serratia fonticola]